LICHLVSERNRIGCDVPVCETGRWCLTFRRRWGFHVPAKPSSFESKDSFESPDSALRWISGSTEDTTGGGGSHVEQARHSTFDRIPVFFLGRETRPETRALSARGPSTGSFDQVPGGWNHGIRGRITFSAGVAGRDDHCRWSDTGCSPVGPSRRRRPPNPKIRGAIGSRAPVNRRSPEGPA
jgi:hypothetical protein